MADILKCCNCHVGIAPGKEYIHQSEIFCGDCAMDIRTPRVRKTHWQYIGSIKTKYLIPSKEKQEAAIGLKEKGNGL